MPLIPHTAVVMVAEVDSGYLRALLLESLGWGRIKSPSSSLRAGHHLEYSSERLPKTSLDSNVQGKFGGNFASKRPPLPPGQSGDPNYNNFRKWISWGIL